MATAGTHALGGGPNIPDRCEDLYQNPQLRWVYYDIMTNAIVKQQFLVALGSDNQEQAANMLRQFQVAVQHGSNIEGCWDTLFVGSNIFSASRKLLNQKSRYRVQTSLDLRFVCDSVADPSEHRGFQVFDVIPRRPMRGITFFVLRSGFFCLRHFFSPSPFGGFYRKIYSDTGCTVTVYPPPLRDSNRVSATKLTFSNANLDNDGLNKDLVPVRIRCPQTILKLDKRRRAKKKHKMKLKHLESALSCLTREFPSPKVDLEQYPTSAHLSACVIQLALDNGDLGQNMSCLDLGCGTGMLSIAASFVCGIVFAIDCDDDALKVAQENAEEVELEDTVHFIKAKVKIGETPSQNNKSTTSRKGGGGGGRHGKQKRGGGSGRGGRGSQPASQTKAILILDDNDGIPLLDKCVDTVVTNPPFGTKHNAGIDVQFLRTATRLSRRAVYSFHKRSTRPFLIKTVQEWGYECQVAAEMEFDIPQMYKFHNKKSKDVEVDLLRVIVGRTEDGGEGEPKKIDDEAGLDTI